MPRRRGKMLSALALPKIERSNNMDLLRLFFAVNVVLSHCGDLAQSPSLDWLNYICDSTSAVRFFFILSGFLIFKSYETTPSLG
jgi:peptidoglycan/LPS O-acetylase OafA/YrhL